MLKFIDTWKINQLKCWRESCKDKISELEVTMDKCAAMGDYKKFFTLMDRLDQEQETYDDIQKEIATLI